jgi:hypothetical protein
MRVQGCSGRHDDRQPDQVGKGHADQRVEADPAIFLVRPGGALVERPLLGINPLLFSFLRRLP